MIFYDIFKVYTFNVIGFFEHYFYFRYSFNLLTMKAKYFFIIAFFLGQLNFSFGQIDSTRFFKTKEGALIYDPYYVVGTEYSWDGETKNGYAEGEGTCRFLMENEEIGRLTGMFSKGLATGECDFVDKLKEEEIKCNYTNGRMLGIGTLKTSYSDRYTGELRDLTMHGVGKLVYSRGSVFEGTFRCGDYWTGTHLNLDDKKSFIYRQENVDSIPRYSKYSPSLNQEVTEYFDEEWNRCRKNEATYYRKITYSKPNTPLGEIKEFYISGHIFSKYFASYIDYNDSYMSFYGPGPMTIYHENGYVSSNQYYNYKGLPDGTYLSYHENGKLETKCYYSNGQLSDHRLDYNDKGVLTDYAYYENGNIKDGKYFSIVEDLWVANYIEDFEYHYDFWKPREENTYTQITESDGLFVALPEEGIYFKTKEYSVDKELQFQFISQISTLKKDFKKDAYVGFIFDYKNDDNYAYVYIDAKLKAHFTKYINGKGYKFADDFQLKLTPEEKKSGVLKFFFFINFYYEGITFYINSQEVHFVKKWEWLGNEYGAMAYGNIAFEIDNIRTKEFYNPETSQKFTEYLEKNVLNDDYSDEDAGYDGNGTGFFISNDGYLVTNYHVVEDAKVIDVQLTVNGKIEKYSADVVVSDKINDLAILKITDKDFKMDKAVPFGLQFGSEDVGSEVFTMGYPLANVMGNEIKFTDGKISSKSGINGDIRMYQISTPIQPGNSGGPLFNAAGNVVGIVSATLNRENYDSENVNYALKSNILKNLIDSAPEKINIKESSEGNKSAVSEKIKTYESFIPMILIKQ